MNVTIVCVFRARSRECAVVAIIHKAMSAEINVAQSPMTDPEEILLPLWEKVDARDSARPDEQPC
jgi:hypothetical protein